MARLGVMIEGQEGLSWPRWRRLSDTVEALGFDSLWRSDHYFSVLGVEGREVIETWVSLALAAEWTKRVEFGPLVSAMTFRQPELLARMAASVDQLAGGRLVLGLGAGWYEREHERFNVPFPPARERFDRFEEGIRRVRETWERSLPRPAREPLPILIGGAGKLRTLRIVAREADEWNCHGLSPADYAGRSQVLEGYCREIGRDPAAIRRSIMVAHLVGRDEADLRARAEAMGAYLPRFNGMTAEEVIRSAGEAGWLVGLPEEVVARIREYTAVGVQRFMLQHHLVDDYAALELVAAEILPAVSVL